MLLCFMGYSIRFVEFIKNDFCIVLQVDFEDRCDLGLYIIC